MGAVNATFSPIEGVRRMTRKWIEVYSERVRGLFLDKENQEFMKVTIPICVSLVHLTFYSELIDLCSINIQRSRISSLFFI